MARMHARRRGIASSVRPFRTEAPEWSNKNAKEVEAKVVELRRTGLSSAAIGLVLRDKHGVPDVKLATGKKINKIIIENNMADDIPEDLRNLMHKALGMRKHLTDNKHDLHNKRQLQLTEAKIRRLVKYYTGNGKLPATWAYSPETAEILLSR
ncbi:MAG TPA: 30S ribosomal protein S15 [Methanocorpusculum sp.]|nr:30S ribosomal protein S15 [Lachnospiraceae bacterium]MCQ2511076.1 30S ribosomal protein S15 [Lachnospiraceae bacterium]MDO5828896.1 30S ribosomal protein S15 [Methanocorpusculum sp.]HJJ27515.1 30S ribosomal protein S15 [Methanocorpusculum sp.]HJJ45691.1 30S ribosomal protein S15 [Methanocorpusculum sp.]